MRTIYPSKLRLRWAEMADADFLLSVKNDPVVRKFSIVSKDRIRRADHLVWLEKAVKDPKRKFYVIEYGETRIGDVRFDIGKEIEVSIRIAKRWRKCGVGKAIIPFACWAMASVYPKKDFIAKIVDGNVASRRLFESCGFVDTGVPFIGFSVLKWKK